MCTYGGALLVKYFNPEIIKSSEYKNKEENNNLNNNNKIDVPKSLLYIGILCKEKKNQNQKFKKIYNRFNKNQI